MGAILLTWGTGFVGSHLLDKLLEEDKEVILLKRTTSNMDKISNLIWNDLVKTIEIDTTSFKQIFEEHTIDVIVHLATSYGRKGESTTQIVESAINLPLQLLENAISHNVWAFINTDSYFNQSIQLSDNIWVHAEAKRDFLKYAKSMIQGKSIKFLNLIMWHVYWPRDSEKKLIPGVIKKLLNEDDYIDLVEWKNERNFIYVKDLIKVYMTMLQHIEKMEDQYQDFYDRTGEVVTVREMVEMLKEITQSKSQFKFGTVPDREKEIMKIHPDLDTLTHRLWWAPKYTIQEWLTETVDYYKSLDS